MPEHRLLASYGRRRGRRLRASKQALVETLLPQLQLSLKDVEMRSDRDVEKFFASLFPRIPTSPHSRLFLEIGFGGGEHLAHQARLHPEAGIIGCEPYINGLAALLAILSLEGRGQGEGRVQKTLAQEFAVPDPHPNPPPSRGRGIKNVRIYNGDARVLMEKLPDAVLDRVFILYPDPWPKARHHKRRLISKEFLDLLARVMKPGAELRLATDDADYCCWMLERLLTHGGYRWTAKTCDDWLKPWPDWIPTRYEQKRLAGMPTYLTFIKSRGRGFCVGKRCEHGI